MKKDLQPTVIYDHFLVRLLLAFAFAFALAFALGAGASDDSSSSSSGFSGSASVAVSLVFLLFFGFSFFSGFKIVLVRSGKDRNNPHGKNQVNHGIQRSCIVHSGLNFLSLFCSMTALEHLGWLRYRYIKSIYGMKAWPTVGISSGESFNQKLRFLLSLHFCEEPLQALLILSP